MALRNLILISFFSLFSFVGFAQNKVILSPENDNQVIGQFLSVFEDPEGTLSEDQTFNSKAYKSCDSKVPNLGFTKGALWLKFTIENLKSDSNFALQINQALLDEVSLYVFSSQGKLISTENLGEKYPVYKRKHRDQYPIFDITIPSGGERIFLLKIKSGEQILLPVQVSTLPNVLERNKNRDLLFGIYFGIILVMMAYNFFIFFTVRDNSYLFYVVYIFCVGFAQACLEGYSLKYLWPDNFWLASRSVYFSTSAVCVSGLLFVRLFLHTKEFTPRLDKFFLFIYFLFIVIIVGNSIEVNSITHNITQVAVGTISFLILYTSILVYRQGYRPAKFFLIAWSVLIVGIFIFVLKDAGVINANIFTTYTLQIGSVIEVMLLSLALADRINILKREKEQSQAEVLKALKENEKLITEQNIVLEEKVKVRTEELEIKNIELGDTLNHLKETQTQLLVVQKMASLGQLTAGIAHEINNPINFVSANIKPLQMDISDILQVLEKYDEISEGDPSIKEKLEGIESFKREIDIDYVKSEINSLLLGIEDGAKRTAEIVKGLKNFSHLDASDIRLADVNKGLESTLVLLRSSIPAHIVIKTDYGNIPMIECYPGKLNQVFMNILNNAVQAIENNKTPKDNYLIIASYLKDDKVCVSIEDSGIGMSDGVKEKIFEPFFTTKDVGEGVGLGMSIVFGIIENHHGKIEIETEPGKGTKVILILPLTLKTAETDVMTNG